MIILLVFSFLFSVGMCQSNASHNRFDAIRPAYLAAFHDSPTSQSQSTALFPDPTLSPRSVRAVAFTILAQEEERLQNFTNRVTGKEEWNNLDLYTHDGKPSTHNLTAALDRTQSIAGRIMLTAMLTNPLTDLKRIKARQAFIRELVKNQSLRAMLKQLITRYAQRERDLLSLTLETDPLYSKKIEFLHYDFPIEDSSAALYKSPFTQELLRCFNDGSSAISLAVYATIPLLILAGLVAHKGSPEKLTAYLNSEDIKMEITTPQLLVSFAATSALAYWQISDFIPLYKQRSGAVNYLRKRFSDLAAYFELTDILSLIRRDAPSIASVIPQALPPQEGMHTLRRLLKHPSMQSSSYFFSRTGSVLATLPHLKELKDHLYHELTSIASLDAYLSIAQLIDESTTRTNAQWCFATFEEQATTPLLNLADFWHPLIPPAKVVSNSISLGGAKKDVVLTGPNAAGKSSILKGIALSISMAQTFGIAPARTAHLTPFTHINTYLNLTDDLTSGKSLFTAELHRAKKLVSRISSLTPGAFSFTILDEILRSTNPQEGEAGAYSITRYISDQEQSISLVATHYPTLPTLAHLNASSIANYHVTATIHDDGSIHYPYKLLPGSNTKNIALDILRTQNFCPELIARAHEIIKETE